MTRTPNDTLVVCGHGMVAQRFLEELVNREDRRYRNIIVFNGEPVPAYNRIQLSALLAGDTTEESLTLKPERWFRDHAIQVHDREPVVAIDRRARTVTTATGRVQPYDSLVLATGSRPSTLGLPGEQLSGVFGFRDLQDTRTLIKLSQQHRRAVVVGGGFLGLEAAEGLRQRGMEVTVLHRGGHLLNRQLDPTGGQILAERLTQRGLNILTGASPVRFLGRDTVRAVQLTDETLISTDLVVVATGITPNRNLAEACGLNCDRGVLVNSQLQTSDPAIHALGECCQLGDHTFGLVEPGFQQASALARVLTSESGSVRYQPTATPTRLKISGLPLFSCGQHAPDDTTESLIWRDMDTGHYCHLLIRCDRLVGAILIGNTADGLWYQERIVTADNIARFRSQLPFGQQFCEAAA